MTSLSKSKKGKTLSVWTALRESTTFTFSNLKIFGKLFLLPILVQTVSSIFINSTPLADPTTPLTMLPLFGSILIIYVAFSVAGPRWIQHYCTPLKTVNFFQFRKAEWQFFGYLVAIFSILFTLIVLGVILSVAILASTMSPSNATEGFSLGQILAIASTLLLTLGFCLLIWVRLFFIFPAVSLSRPTSLKQAWKETKPYWKKLMGIALILVACLGPLSLFDDRSWPFIFIGATLTTLISAIADICITKFYLASRN